MDLIIDATDAPKGQDRSSLRFQRQVGSAQNESAPQRGATHNPRLQPPNPRGPGHAADSAVPPGREDLGRSYSCG